MKIETHGDTLRVSGVQQLGAASAGEFRDRVREAFNPAQRNIDIDLSGAIFLDSCGLGALISLHKAAGARNGVLRLLNPPGPVRQMLSLTRLDRFFRVVKDGECFPPSQQAPRP